ARGGVHVVEVAVVDVDEAVGKSVLPVSFHVDGLVLAGGVVDGEGVVIGGAIAGAAIEGGADEGGIGGVDGAGDEHRRPRQRELGGAGGAAAVAVDHVAVVALLVAHHRAVAADLLGLAVGVAAIPGVAVAVVAGLGQIGMAVAAHAGLHGEVPRQRGFR